MKDRTYDTFLEDIVNSIEKIERFTKSMDFVSFEDNELVRDAVIRNIEIIGEASKNIPENIRNENPLINWKGMIGLRNVVSHGYFGIDYSIIWQVITRNLSSAKPLLIELLKRTKDSR